MPPKKSAPSPEPLPASHNPKPARKRAASDTDSSSDTTTTTKNPPAPRKRKTPTPATPDPDPDPVIPWPPYFTHLERTHRALNLVYTFCSARKQLLTTLDALRAAVEAHTRCPLTVEDVAGVVALRPEGVRFAYADEVALRYVFDPCFVYLGGGAGGIGSRGGMEEVC